MADVIISIILYYQNNNNSHNICGFFRQKTGALFISLVWT